MKSGSLCFFNLRMLQFWPYLGGGVLVRDNEQVVADESALSLAPTSSSLKPTIHIRLATLGDVKVLADLLVHSFHGSEKGLHLLAPLIRLGISEDLRTRLRRTMPYYSCLVALNSETQEILGTVEISLKGWFSVSSRHCYLSNLAVSPHHRRQGVARQLLLRCEQITRLWNCSRLSLHVLDNNLGAQRLYLRLGYVRGENKGLGGPRQGFWTFAHRPRKVLLEKLIGT